MTDRTFGTLKWESNTWVLDVEPYVSMRLKRIFPRVKQQHTSALWIRDTPEVAHDLEWILQRWPLDVAPIAAERLAARAGQYRDREEARIRVMAGDTKLDLAEPARPARPYQLQAADLLLTTGQLLLADDVGLGKTFSSLLTLREPDALPAVVVTLTHLPPQWLGELDKSFPWLTGEIATTTQPHDIDADVLILSYSKLNGWADHLAGQMRTVIFDEVQELRKRGTLKYDAARRLAGPAAWRMGLSATPVYNYADEIHTIYDVLAPDALGTREEFLREWSGADVGNGRIKLSQPAALGAFLRDEGLMLRRTRKDVKREIPDPIRVVHQVDTDTEVLEAVQGDIHALAELIAATSTSNEDRFRAAGEIDWKLRHATGVAKAGYVAEFVRLLLESEDRVVLFGWHHDVYDIWLDQLAEFNPALYTGRQSTPQKTAAAQAFLNGDSRVLIMSLRSGAGLDGLQHRASVLVFGELDWSPSMHDQCIGRLARDGQEEAVAAYYLVSGSGSDPVVADVLELKRQQAEPIRNPDQPLLETNDAGHDRIRLLVNAVLKEK